MPTPDALLHDEQIRAVEERTAEEAVRLLYAVLSEAAADAEVTHIDPRAILDQCRARSSGELKNVFDRWSPRFMNLCIYQFVQSMAMNGAAGIPDSD